MISIMITAIIVTIVNIIDKRSRSEGAPTRGEEGEPFSPTLSPKELYHTVLY